MPNIELFGYEQQTHARELIDKIKQALRGKSYEKDYVITVHHGTYVIDYRGKRQPFIRLVSTRNDHNEEILNLLRSLTVDMEGVDVEYAILEDFFPKS